MSQKSCIVNFMRISFHGGAREVTGACYLLETSNKQQATRILIDCGLFQGSSECEDLNYEKFKFDPKTIEALFVTHGHLDHVGRIPKLVAEGFKGKIYSTPPTRQIAQLMLEDTLRIIAREAKVDNHEPLYREEAVRHTMTLWETVPYDQEIIVGE